MINTPPCSGGTKPMDGQTYRRILSVGKTTKKRGNDMPQDSENDLHAMSCEPSYKRQRVGSATQKSQRYSCLSGGVMVHCQKSSSTPKDVCNQELGKALPVGGTPVVKANNFGSNESPLAVQDSSKSPSADSNNPKFTEFWVPVQLTDIQLEHYCSTLMQNTELLCSLKKQSLDLLQDVLVALRKCCDHPYVLDSSLQTFFKKRCPPAGFLSLGIQASGKLQLLRKLLPKIREQGLRVLIVYKTTSSPVKNDIGIGDILDDFICQSFGQKSYVHIYTKGNIPPKEKQTAVDLFNDRNSGRFVVLSEYCSPPVSIRITSLDVVILFNSDLLNPLTDTRSLQKMSLHTDNGQLRVLRLYSVWTVEEKALCMAHASLSTPSSRQYISTSICQKLLNWGATCLFERLDALASNKSLEDEFCCSVLDELSAILSSSHPAISKVKEVGEGCYENIELHGELKVKSFDDAAPHVVWSSLLQGRIPRWHYLPNEAGCMEKRISFCERPPETSAGLLYEEIPGWHRDTNHCTKRRKRVPQCISGFQEKLLEVKTLWYNDTSENIKKVDRPHRKRRPEKKKMTKELLITEMCGESYRKVGRFQLDDEIQPGRICNDVDKSREEEIDAPSSEIQPGRICNDVDKSREEEIDAPSSASIESINLITPESSIGEELNTEKGNNLPTENSSMCKTLEEVNSDQFVLQEGLDILAECSPCNEMIVAIGSDSENIYVRPKAVPVAESSDPIPNLIVLDSELGADEDQSHAPENPVSGSLSVTKNQSPINGIQSSEELAIQSDTVKDIPNLVVLVSESSLSESELGADEDKNHATESAVSGSLSVTENRSPINGIQSSEELAIQSDTVKDISDPWYEEMLLCSEQITVQESIDQIHQSPPEQCLILGTKNHAPENAVSGSLSVTENQSPINGIQSSEELAIQSDTVKDISDPWYEEMLHLSEQITVQESIDQIHQSPSEQLPPTPLPAPQNAVPDQGLINGIQSAEELAKQSSEELAIQSNTVEDIPDTLRKEMLHSNDQTTLQESINEIRPLPTEQLPASPLPCLDIRVAEESAPSSSCEIVEIEVESQPIQSQFGGSMRPNTFRPLQSFMQTENRLMMHPNDDPHIYQTTSLNPFQVELERIQNTEISLTKKHEDTLSQLKAARDKEMEQIHKKYGLLFQNAQKDFTQEKQELKISHEKIKAQKALADAWKLFRDDIPIYLPPSPMPTTATQMHIQPPYQTVLPPFPPPYQNLGNFGLGYGPYALNPYLYSPFPTQFNQLRGYPPPQPNQYPLSTAAAYSQLYSQLEYLAYNNIPI